MSVRVNPSETLTHIVSDGETWDQLAYRYYGDANAFEPIIRANPHVPIRPVLTPGTELAIPVMEAPTVASSPGNPPWR